MKPKRLFVWQLILPAKNMSAGGLRQNVADGALMVTLAVIAWAWPMGLRAQGDVGLYTDALFAEFEKGPATIDVSRYPAGIQVNYALFSRRCSQCHQLSRPINYDHALPDEWSRYVKRMMRKPGSGISPAEARDIYEFLVYDISVRRSELLYEKLAAVPPPERTNAEARIQGIRKKYDSR